MNIFKTFLIICIVLGSISCGSKTGNKDASELFPFPPSRLQDISASSQMKYGYMNREGFLIIEQQFDWADYFYEGLAHVRVGNKHGYIDTQGKFVINPQFDWAWRFSEGLALVKSGDKHGYIDKSGKYVINIQFDNADGFSDGLALVGVGGKFGYIDKSGKYVIEPHYSDAGPFSDGLAYVKMGDKCGFIDKTGRTVIEPQFQCSAYSFGIFAPLGKFSEGLFAVSDNNRKVGFIDKTGKFVIAPRFDYAYDFSEGLAAVGIDFKSGARPYEELPIDEPVLTDRPVVWGFIDKTGNFAIKPRFAMVASFSDGFAAVSIEHQFNCGYIDKSGKFFIGPRLISCGGFDNGIAAPVRKKGEESYESLIIDTSGKIIHPRNSGSLGNDNK